MSWVSNITGSSPTGIIGTAAAVKANKSNGAGISTLTGILGTKNTTKILKIAAVASDIYDLSKYGFNGSQKGYRPSQWGSAVSASQLVGIKTNIGAYFFDAIFNTSTEHVAELTEHPIQNGANITDHVIIHPVTITMEIGMSDCMARMVADQWTGAETKSINAYKKLVELMEARQPLDVKTRLNVYKNMIIRSISVEDNVSTLYGLRASVSMQQIIMANVSDAKVSAREWSSGGETSKGSVSPKGVDDSSNPSGTSVMGQIDSAGSTTRAEMNS